MISKSNMMIKTGLLEQFRAVPSLQCTDTGRGNMSLYLGGKAATDDAQWTPNMDTVRATIRFAIATGRLDAN
jgi:hypothetical protein